MLHAAAPMMARKLKRQGWPQIDAFVITAGCFAPSEIYITPYVLVVLPYVSGKKVCRELLLRAVWPLPSQCLIVSSSPVSFLSRNQHGTINIVVSPYILYCVLPSHETHLLWRSSSTTTDFQYLTWWFRPERSSFRCCHTFRQQIVTHNPRGWKSTG